MYIRNDIYHPSSNQEKLKRTAEGIKSSIEAIHRVIDKLLDRQSGFKDIFGTNDQFGMRADGSYGVPYRYMKDYTMSTDGVNMIGFEEENDEDR